MALEIIGQTNYLKDICMAKVGDPSNDALMIMTQLHGNEPLTTEAALQLLKKLGTGSKQAMKILGELYVLVIVRVNPEGAEFFTRGNADFNAPPRDSRDCFDDEGNVDPALINQGRAYFRRPIRTRTAIEFPTTISTATIGRNGHKAGRFNAIQISMIKMKGLVMKTSMRANIPFRKQTLWSMPSRPSRTSGTFCGWQIFTTRALIVPRMARM